MRQDNKNAVDKRKHLKRSGRPMKFNNGMSAILTMVWARLLVVSCLVLASVATGFPGRISGALAGVKAGDVITPENATQVKDLLSPGVYYKVVNGMSMKVVPTQRIDWPPPYKEATEKYSSQVRLSKDGRTVVGYVAGEPFPLVDVNDPDVATKIAWNNVFLPILTADYDLR